MEYSMRARVAAASTKHDAQLSMNSIFKPAIMLMAGRAAGFVMAFAIPIVLVRVFTQNEFGTYKQLFLIYTTLYAIAQMGMAESLYYFLPAARSSGGRYALNAMLVLGGAGLVCLALLCGLEPYLGRWFNNPGITRYLPLIGIYLFFMLAATILEIVMTARKQYRHAFLAYVLSDLVRSLLCILPVLLFGGLEWLLWGSIGFAVLRFSATLGYLRREFAGDVRPDAALLRSHLAYAVPFSLAVLIDSAQSNLHMYVVSYHFNAAVFAIYAVGCLQVPMVDFMMTSTSSVMMVRMREHIYADEGTAVLSIWNDTTRKLALVFVPLVGGLLVVADKLILALFTPAYAASIPLFMVWSTTILMTALMTDSVLRVYAQTRLLIFLNLTRLAFVAVTVNWAVTHLGLMGAVLVTVGASFSSKVLALAMVKTLMHASFAELLPWRALATSAAIAAAAMVPALLIKHLI